MLVSNAINIITKYSCETNEQKKDIFLLNVG